ncbi:Formin-like protein 14 [Labeo rohita]|uniref:Formin-like protein 14 n=1 Tax=Labeo rohita TaxID=84645 RepID=A0ABQ8KZW5_LABRO|nr:Formin-like protein 14 [Labeo rohita]
MTLAHLRFFLKCQSTCMARVKPPLPDWYCKETSVMTQGTEEETENLVKFCMELDSDFTGKRNSAKKAWIIVLQRIGLDGKVTPSQISKKWDNLKRKYKELRCPPTGTGTDGGEATAATWPWFSAMHEAIGGRPSIEPPILID